jgi:glycosyltransferase involved in cell wall biosynthesis
LRLLWVGGDFERKGLDPMLDALAGISEVRPHLRVVGMPHDPGIFRRAQERVATLGLGNSVSFLGQVTDRNLEAMWAENDVYVQPSLHEGHGLALDEALVRGMPAVISDLPVFRQRLGPEDVLFSPPGDSATLREALTAVRPHEVRTRLAAAARARASTFPSWDDTLAAYETLVRSELERVP